MNHHEIARQLLAQLGRTGEFALEPMPGGRNNRVWRLSIQDDDFLFKQYYWSEADPRDRMGHEWDFLVYLSNGGSIWTPKPVAADREHRCALLEFIHGRRLSLEEIGEREVSDAALFFFDAQTGADLDLATALPAASEACFSLAEHLQITERRILRLEQIVPEDEAHRAAAALATEEILPLWEKVRARIIQIAPEIGGLEMMLASHERCLSPSDFGFHNALRPSTGNLRFVDFEYAGWDDPAKTIADFANQPDMLLEASLSDRFRDGVLNMFAHCPNLSARVRLLTPLYQVKWACICLNEFLPAGSARRAFTGLSPDEGLAQLEGHLRRARLMAERAAESINFSFR